MLNWIDLLAMRSTVPKQRTAKKRVVFVKMDGIGDYVIWTAAFGIIRKQYPSDGHERILIANDRFRSLAENEPTFDKTIFLNHESFVLSPAYRSKMMRRLRDLGADIIINARSTRDLLWADSIIRCSAAKEKIGSEDTGSMISTTDLKVVRRWYTHLRPALRPGEHELIWHAKFLGIPVDEISISGGLDAVSGSEPLIPGDYAIFFIGAQSGEKCWPSKHFGEVAEYVARQYGLKVVLCGGPDAGYLADGFKTRFVGESIDHIGPTAIALPEVVNLIRSAALVVANDTGTAHISVFAGRPTIVTAPGNQSGRYFPYPDAARLDRLKVVQKASFCVDCKEDCKFTRVTAAATRPCLEAISVDEVIGGIDELFRSHGRQPLRSLV